MASESTAEKSWVSDHSFSTTAQEKIIGGSTVPSSEGTFVVSLLFCNQTERMFAINGKGAQYCAETCTGTLIAPNTVITAAHCVWNKLSLGPMTVDGARMFVSIEHDWASVDFPSLVGQ